MTAIMYRVAVFPRPGGGTSWSFRRDTWRAAQDMAVRHVRQFGGRAEVKQERVHP